MQTDWVICNAGPGVGKGASRSAVHPRALDVTTCYHVHTSGRELARLTALPYVTILSAVHPSSPDFPSCTLTEENPEQLAQAVAVSGPKYRCLSTHWWCSERWLSQKRRNQRS